jgi:hypothetical protein
LKKSIKSNHVGITPQNKTAQPYGLQAGVTGSDTGFTRSAVSCCPEKEEETALFFLELSENMR